MRRKIFFSTMIFFSLCVWIPTPTIAQDGKSKSWFVSIDNILIRFWNISFKKQKILYVDLFYGDFKRLYSIAINEQFIFNFITREALIYRVLKKFSLFYYLMCGWAILSLQSVCWKNYEKRVLKHLFFFRAKLYCKGAKYKYRPVSDYLRLIS